MFQPLVLVESWLSQAVWRQWLSHPLPVQRRAGDMLSEEHKITENLSEPYVPGPPVRHAFLRWLKLSIMILNFQCVTSYIRGSVWCWKSTEQFFKKLFQNSMPCSCFCTVISGTAPWGSVQSTGFSCSVHSRDAVTAYLAGNRRRQQKIGGWKLWEHLYPK